jgi:hypothetical protein
MLESLVCFDNGLSYLCGVIDPEILIERIDGPKPRRAAIATSSGKAFPGITVTYVMTICQDDVRTL